MGPTTADQRGSASKKRIKKNGTAYRTTLFLLSTGLLSLFSCPAGAVPTISPGHATELTISDIGSAFFDTSTNRSRITQMAFGPGPDVNKSYLYTATNGSGFATPALDGVYRFEYDPGAGTLSNSTQIIAVNGNGIAFHNGSMYLSEPYQSSGGKGLSQIWRITDNDGDGIFLEADTTSSKIVRGIPSNGHTANQLQISGNSLYVTVGTNSSNGAFGGGGGDSAYNGALTVIEDLTQVPSTDNSAGFFPSDPSNSLYDDLVDGTDPSAALPFTSTAANKLRVHSSGTRNPFGLAVDGDGEIWFSNNFQRVDNDVYDRDNIANAEPDSFSSNPFGLDNDVHDQFFKAEQFADYGYRNANWQTSATAQAAGFFLPDNRRKSFTFDNYVDPDAVDAGGSPSDFDNLDPGFNVLHDPTAPVGLGASSSSNGLDFYDGNAFGFEYQKDAFIARFVGTVPDGNFGGTSPSITYRDVVSVDTDTGKVNRIAQGFNNPLDVLADANGNLLVADWNGSIYRIEATNPFTGTHPFNWDSDSDGNWSDRLTWNTNLSGDDRLVPHAWGTARYAVTIDRTAGNPTITLDQNATIESLLLADRLHLGSGNVLTVQDLLTIAPGGTLGGTGSVAGPVSVTGGTVAPGESTGILTVDSATFDSNSTLAVELGGSGGVAGTDFDQLLVTNAVTLGGDLTIDLLGGFIPFAADTFTVLSAGTLSGSFSNVANGARLNTLDGAASLLVSYDGTTDTIVLSDFMPSLDGDFDLSGVVDGFDFLKWQQGKSPVPSSQSDLNDWETNYGAVASTSAATVPEPSSLLLGVMASMGLMLRRKCLLHAPRVLPGCPAVRSEYQGSIAGQARQWHPAHMELQGLCRKPSVGGLSEGDNRLDYSTRSPSETPPTTSV